MPTPIAGKKGTSLVNQKSFKENFYPPLNFALIDEEYTDFGKAKFVVLSIPYDVMTTYEPGARKGPSAIITASQFVELYDHELDLETFKFGIHTLPDLIPAVGNPAEMVDRVYQTTKSLIKAKKTVVGLGGDHSVSIGLIKAHTESYPKLSILHIDAHSDLRDDYEGSKLSGATTMRRAYDMGAKITQVGIRAFSEEESKFTKKAGIKLVLAEEIMGNQGNRGDKVRQPADWVEEIIQDLGERVYISLDVDGFDPSIMSATGTPEPGGLGWYEVINLLKRVSESKKIVGFDVVELSPDLGPHSCSFLAAKLIYKIMGYIGKSE